MPRSPHCTIRVFYLNISVKLSKVVLHFRKCFFLCFAALTSVGLDVYLVRKKVKRKDFVPRLHAGLTPKDFHSHRLKTESQKESLGVLLESRRAPVISIVKYKVVI